MKEVKESKEIKEEKVVFRSTFSEDELRDLRIGAAKAGVPVNQYIMALHYEKEGVAND